MESPANKTDNLNRILASEAELAPSSGFVAAVMERVREEAAAPAPIPFPWKRVLPGMVAAGAGLGWCAVELVKMGIAERGTASLIPLQSIVSMSKPLEGAGWVAAALGLSLLSWLLARRIAGSGGLV